MNPTLATICAHDPIIRAVVQLAALECIDAVAPFDFVVYPRKGQDRYPAQTAIRTRFAAVLGSHEKDRKTPPRADRPVKRGAAASSANGLLPETNSPLSSAPIGGTD